MVSFEALSYKLQDSLKQYPKNIILPAIAYTPETSVSLGISGVRVYYTDTVSRASQWSTTMLYTFKNQLLIELAAQLFFRENQYLLKSKFNFNQFPEYYYGIGNNTQEHDKTIVQYNVVKWEGSITRRLAKRWYGGPKMYISKYFNMITEKSYVDNHRLYGLNGGLTTGVGFASIYDSRDNIMNARKGWYWETSAVWNRKELGGDYQYFMFMTDLRKYIALSTKTILAWQGVGQIESGQVPFLQLSYLGGNTIMRGFYSGRYRDNNLIATQAEIRQELTPKWGVVAFAGLGQVFNQWLEVSIPALQHSLGLGLRRVLNKSQGINLRLDVGFGNGQSNFYINIAEAF